MRGKGIPPVSAQSARRITPAYAGKRFLVFFKAKLFQDHPRLCGEKFSPRYKKCLTAGSPPPMRGKDNAALFRVQTVRITPAYAGKSTAVCTPVYAYRDHPRLCGEKSCWKHWRTLMTGSPPPMRGKEKNSVQSSKQAGITPAYAGKRQYHHLAAFQSRDHPRLCGEKACRDRCGTFAVGSPPPMRGKAAVFSSVVGGVGITPAYAGKSDNVYLLDEAC